MARDRMNPSRISHRASDIAKDAHAAYWLSPKDDRTADFLMENCRRRLGEIIALLDEYEGVAREDAE